MINTFPDDSPRFFACYVVPLNEVCGFLGKLLTKSLRNRETNDTCAYASGAAL